MPLAYAAAELSSLIECLTACFALVSGLPKLGIGTDLACAGSDVTVGHGQSFQRGPNTASQSQLAGGGTTRHCGRSNHLAGSAADAPTPLAHLLA